ncbi:hypothetical protein JHK87_023869 [Glycine soja]|nr:hypothetical protein JHK87_023869 [Glycine soja]
MIRTRLSPSLTTLSTVNFSALMLHAEKSTATPNLQRSLSFYLRSAPVVIFLLSSPEGSPDSFTVFNLQPLSSKEQSKLRGSFWKPYRGNFLAHSESAANFFQWRFGGHCSFWHSLSPSASSFSFSFIPRFLPSTSTLRMVPPRGTAQQSSGKVQCYEPATMKYLGYVPALTPDEVCEPMLLRKLIV